MPAFAFRASRLAPLVAACAVVAGCGSIDSATHRLASSITPYKIEIVQGNFVSREQVDALKPGMGRQQVRDILGTPLIADAFHAERWDYVFTIKRREVEPQQRRLTVFFKNDVLERVDGDLMPTESEFVATLDNRRKGATVPPMQATDDQLQRFAESNKSAAPAPAASEPAGPARTYPPLETSPR
jgi:outer membrane protein assembly factor BamE